MRTSRVRLDDPGEPSTRHAEKKGSTRRIRLGL